MGDRTWVHLTVLKEHSFQVDQLVGKPSDYDHIPAPEGDRVQHFFEEINYGELDGLEALKAAGIPYSLNWGQGDNYGPGEEHLRFTEQGVAIHKNWADEDAKLSVYDLHLKLNDHEQLKKTILAVYDNVTMDESWDNQEEYGRRYVAAQLIAPTE